MARVPLAADLTRGKLPGIAGAAAREQARELYDYLITLLRGLNQVRVQTVTLPAYGKM